MLCNIIKYNIHYKYNKLFLTSINSFLYITEKIFLNERMNEEKWWDFISAMAGVGKTGIGDTESWRVSKSVTKPVNEAGSFHGEWNSIPSWLALEEKSQIHFFADDYFKRLSFAGHVELFQIPKP